MPLYDYVCKKCNSVFEVDKKMSSPGPATCPKCGSEGPERHFGDTAPSVVYANRPPWTYRECLKYKDCKFNDGPRTKIDPRKHGDVGAWHSPGEVMPDKNKRKGRRR
jgi:putative FmdB family regulatory protein